MLERLISEDDQADYRRPYTFNCRKCGEEETRFYRVWHTGTFNGRLGAICRKCKQATNYLAQQKRRGAKPRTSFWTAEKKEQAIALYNDHKSGSEIADIIGSTRGAVIGFLYRSGFKRIRTTKSEAERKYAKQPRRPKQRFGGDPSRPGTVKCQNPLPLATVPPIPESEWVPFPRDSQSQCAAIMDNEGKRCCGRKVAYRSYCSDHARLYYVMRRAQS